VKQFRIASEVLRDGLFCYAAKTCEMVLDSRDMMEMHVTTGLLELGALQDKKCERADVLKDVKASIRPYKLIHT
jgi:hypothetical protein